MPKIYLSPSTQENNIYVSGGSEEYYANLIADALVKYLSSSGIQFVRNSPEMNAAAAIAQSNSIKNDLHLAIHTNAAPPDMYGALRGIDVYYYPTSTRGRRLAEIIARNLEAIYPDPSLVDVFEFVVAGRELCPGYTEQNDPLEQRKALENQAGEDTEKIDEDFISALECGMPPTGGLGFGVDRLVMFLTGCDSIRDVVLFPQMKPTGAK